MAYIEIGFFIKSEVYFRKRKDSPKTVSKKMFAFRGAVPAT